MQAHRVCQLSPPCQGAACKLPGSMRATGTSLSSAAEQSRVTGSVLQHRRAGRRTLVREAAQGGTEPLTPAPFKTHFAWHLRLPAHCGRPLCTPAWPVSNLYMTPAACVGFAALPQSLHSLCEHVLNGLSLTCCSAVLQQFSSCKHTFQ